MKKLLVIGIFSIIFGATNLVTALTPQANPETVPIQYATEMPPTIIDDVAIPYDVLMYAQMKYQGYAVTQAGIVTINGTQTYRLRVDRDSNPSDFDSIYLLYDMNWQLLGDQKTVAPPPVVENEDKDNKDKVEEKPETDPGEGRGGGFVEEEEAEPPIPEPVEEPSVEPEVITPVDPL
jgi:hypothetical protein